MATSWLKGFMVRETITSGLDRAAQGILDLSSPPFDDAAMMNWLWATLWKITKRYKEIK